MMGYRKKRGGVGTESTLDHLCCELIHCVYKHAKGRINVTRAILNAQPCAAVMENALQISRERGIAGQQPRKMKRALKLYQRNFNKYNLHRDLTSHQV